jgi:hypothetical protein
MIAFIIKYITHINIAAGSFFLSKYVSSKRKKLLCNLRITWQGFQNTSSMQFFIPYFLSRSYFSFPSPYLRKPFKEINEIFSVMKMLPAGGTQLIGRGKDKNVGEMKLRKLRAKNEIENRKGG